MANTFDGRLIVDARWNFQRALDLSSPKDEDSVKSEVRLNSTENVASSIYEVDELFHDQGSVSTRDVINLSSIDNSFGEETGFATVKAVVVINRSTTSGNNLIVGGSTGLGSPWGFPFNGNQDALNIIGPGSVLVWANLIDGYTVQAGSQDLLQIRYSGVSAPITYDVVVFGTKA